MEITEEQRRRAEANRLAALERRKRAAESSQQPDAWRLFKCPKIAPAPPPAQKPPPPPPPPPLPGFRVVLEICSPDEFSVSPEPLDESPFPGETECLRTIENCLLSVVPFSLTQSQNGRLSSIFKLSDYDQVLKCLKKLRQIKIQDIPYKTRLVVQKFAPCTGNSWSPLMEGHCTDEQVEDLLSNIPASLRNALLPFQLEGVRFGLRRGGRCLIADEMGLGKTLQAITIACCFRSEGSILIVCPAVLRYSWAEELERWIPIFLPNDIHLVFGHQNSLHYLEHCPKVVIISYRMLSRLKKSMIDKNWALMIIDESHNIRCTKKKSEKDETKTILELASTIKRIVLLSGTPSLSRPYDIYHQINILWPQLLGSNKYEFAKNYCLLGAVKGSQGKLYQDFSKGTRLSELNVLLRQTLMIRRLKEHVLDQLPPKRRQIIRLKLKVADIQLASTACKERRSDVCYSQHPNTHCEGLDQVDAQGGNGCKKLLKDLSPQEIGIAKLSGFSEWFSNNCITSEEPDSDVDVDMQYAPQKTIIFGHHLKVLDGIQASISNNGIKFVRIDGSTTPRERQNAVESFRSSSEVKVAIIGITAGGVGLDFSLARNVIFLELPKTASDLLQAEDRAHRRGQKNAVNIYIFCAKGTADELNWPRLNKNLFSVSSVMNGKKDAINEFEVDDVYSFSRGSDDQMQTEELDSTAKQTSSASRLQVIEEPGATLSDQKEMNEDFLIRTVPFIVMDKDHDSHLQEQAQMDVNVENCGSVTSLDGESSCISRKSKQRIMSSAGSSNYADASFSECGELDAVDDIRAEYLRFEVSQHTGRIHLYVCVPERDSRPRPLYENLRPEELESPISSGKGLITTLLLKSDTKFHHVLLKFLSEWGNLRPIERNKLLGKPLQLPLSIELCYLKESINHSSQGLLKGGSNRRVTPYSDISNSLPENAEWKKVILCGGPSKEWEYTQAWIGGEQPLCKLCQRPCNGKLAKSPEYFEDLFCNLTCFQEYRIRTSQSALRQALFQIEHGICDNCKLDCSALVKCLRPLSVRRRIEYIKQFAPNIAAKKKLLNKIANEPTEGNSWHADHKVPVYRGGGECTLENLRTLCVACHYEVTKTQCHDRKLIKQRAKELLKNASKENGKEEDDEDLLVSVPGSSYSKRETDVSTISDK
ncbi:DNA annealing helicase and endonuclease ZRANB3 [Carex littledalei]|uniref:DNA annealing helicase and endonuclease ZRANB3 n=1 Tax=Carex littledalei TaxID=544730 RepID=A0A833QPN1_9POAL|nr:DNA annealing helicase and endonuclease ZRANB3 [Carex littledalei]